MGYFVDVSDLAAGQWGLFTTAQARAVGVTAQQVARYANRGVIDRVRHGAYRLSGTPFAREEEIRAAWLLIDPAMPADQRLRDERPAVVSHKSAAYLHGLGDVDADVMEFTVPRRKQSRLSDVRYRVGEVPRERWTLVDGLPVTTMLATIEDLAADRLGGGHLAGIVRDAVTTGGLSPDDVAAALRPYAHTYGAPAGDGSALLDRFLTEAGVPEAAEQLSQRLQASRESAMAQAHEAMTEALSQSTSLAAGSPLRRALAEMANIEVRAVLDQMRHQIRLVDADVPLHEAIRRLQEMDKDGDVQRVLAELRSAAAGLPPEQGSRPQLSPDDEKEDR